jgi:hypothetical protein
MTDEERLAREYAAELIKAALEEVQYALLSFNAEEVIANARTSEGHGLFQSQILDIGGQMTIDLLIKITGA